MWAALLTIVISIGGFAASQTYEVAPKGSKSFSFESEAACYEWIDSQNDNFTEVGLNAGGLIAVKCVEHPGEDV